MQQVQLAINNISSLSTAFNGGTNLFADNTVLTQYVNQLRGLTAQQVQLVLSTKLLTAEQKQQIMSELGLVATENTIQSELLQTALAQSWFKCCKTGGYFKKFRFTSSRDRRNPHRKILHSSSIRATTCFTRRYRCASRKYIICTWTIRSQYRNICFL